MPMFALLFRGNYVIREEVEAVVDPVMTLLVQRDPMRCLSPE
jgi:hypothetical protein